LVLPSSDGQPRLPNNAYDALREYTKGLKKDGLSAGDILDRQLKLLGRLPIFKDEVQRIKDTMKSDTQPELSQTARDRLMLRLPAAAINAQIKSHATESSSSSTSTPPSTITPQAAPSTNPPTQTSTTTSSSKPTSSTPSDPTDSSDRQRAQQNEYRQMQRAREQQQREERERIKAQIKSDREERRRREQVPKQNDLATTTTTTTNTTSASVPPRPSPTETRVQVRTFDGSVLRSTFTPTSTIAADLRPWIDAEVAPNVPYDFKLILTPQPNKKIEASEEALSLRDLGVRGSCTFVIAPVKGFVDSYSGGGSGIMAGGAGLVGGVVSGGYNLVTGTAGAVLGGVGRMFGFGGAAAGDGNGQRQEGQQVGQNEQQQGARGANLRVRTLADQRADEASRRGSQFYNGNTLNFEPNRDGDRDQRKQD
jgi:hypothetical protein